MEIREAIKTLSIGAQKLSEEEASEIVAAARDRFVQGNPASWWQALKLKFDWVSSEGLPLESVLPETGSEIYFVPETEEDALPVYKLPSCDLSKLIGECAFFEYYVLALDLSWLLIENDHNAYYVCKWLPDWPKSEALPS